MPRHESSARRRAEHLTATCARSRRTARLARVTGLALATCLAAGAEAQAPPIIAAETFYVPIPENDAAAVFRFLDEDSTFDRIISVVSIANSIAGTIIVYDHHEDGFEVDLANPAQPTTEVWGDGDPLNGDVCLVATEADCENDRLGSGDVVLLRDEVEINDAGQPVDEDPDGAGYDFNGSDKFIATKPIAVTRIAWAPDPGPDTLLAGAVELLPTVNWGTEFEAPVGETDSSDQMLELTTASYMATEPNTTLSFDNNGDGDFDDVELGETSVTLEFEGDAFLVPLALPVATGARVVSDKPIQAHAITGDIGSNWETRWANLPPASEFGSEYYVPVSTRIGDMPGDTADPTDVFVYNPRSQNAGSITVECQALAPCLDQDNLEQASVVVPRGQSRRFRLPQFSTDGSRETGARLTSTGGERFYAIALVDANPQTDDTDSSDNSNANNRDYDWGIALAPRSQLSPQALVGFAPAIDPEDCASGEPFDCAPPAQGGDGSPLWIMVARDPDGDPDNPDDNPGIATTVIIDHDGDPGRGSQREVKLLPLERVRVFDNDATVGEGDNDNTGTIVYTLDGTPVVVAWGQDPSSSVRGSPYLDAGTIVPAVPLFQIVKGVDQSLVLPGAILTYTVILSNVSEARLLDFEVTDLLPDGVTYVADSLQVDGADFVDEGFPSGALRLDEVDARSDVFITFQVTVNDDVLADAAASADCKPGEKRLVNVVTARQGTYEFDDSATTCVEFPPPEIDIAKEIEGPDSRTFDKFADVDFAITVTNTGVVDLESVVVTDLVSPQCDNDIGPLAAGASFSYSCTVPVVVEPFDNEACVLGVSARGEEARDCDESTVVLDEPPLGLGCSVSSWLQPAVFLGLLRPDIDLETTFSETFGRDDFGTATLYQALALRTTRRGLKGLAAQATAGVLNATANGIDYGLTVNQVVTLFNTAVDGGDADEQKALRKFLRQLNARFCTNGC